MKIKKELLENDCIIVKVKNNIERNELLQVLEDTTDLLWFGYKDKPTKFNFDKCSFDYLFIDLNDRDITYANSKHTVINELMKDNIIICRYKDLLEMQFTERVKDGDIFYYITGDNSITRSRYEKSRDWMNRLIEMGNFFETKEEASKYEIKIVEKESY